jgi:aerotaxis receptor
MRDVDSGLDGIIARLENFHDNTDRYLAELSGKASQVTQKGSAI